MFLAVGAFVMGVVVHRTRTGTWKGIIYRVCGVSVVGLWVDRIRCRVKSETYQDGLRGTMGGKENGWSGEV